MDKKIKILKTVGGEFLNRHSVFLRAMVLAFEDGVGYEKERIINILESMGGVHRANITITIEFDEIVKSRKQKE